MSAGSLDLGELYAKLAIDYSDLHKAELSALNFASNTNKELAKINRGAESLKSVDKNLSTYVTAPLVGAGLASIKFATDFDKSVREVNSLLDSKDQNFQGLKNEIRSVSTELGIDLVESAQAAYEALGAGVPKNNLIDFLRVSGKAAIGGVTSTATVVDGLTTVTNAWGESAGDAQRIADEMFIAVKYGKVTFEEMAASMATVGGLGPELGVSFREVAAASAVMTAQGVPQAQAMTQMRAAMSALLGPNEEMNKLLKSAGIESVRATVKQLGLAKTYDLLRKASDKSGISLEKSVGSVEALGFVLKTTGVNSDKFQTSLDQVVNATGAANAAFEELDKARGFDKLINNSKALATVIGDQLLPIINPMLETFTSWIVEASKLDPGLTRIGIALAAVAAAVGPVLIGAGSLLGLLAPIISGAGGLSGILASLTAVAGPVGLAFAAIAAAGFVLYKNWNDIKTFVIGFVDSVIAYFQKWVSENSGLIATLTSNWNAFLAAVSVVWNTLTEVISSFVQSSISYLNELLEPIGGLQGAWELFKAGVGIALTEVGKFLNDFLVSSIAVLEQVNNLLKTGDWTFFKELALSALKEVSRMFVSFALSVNDELKKLPIYFVQIFTEITNYIRTINWTQLGVDLMTGLKNGIVNSAAGVVEAVKAAGGAVVDGAKEAFDSHSPSLVFMQIGKDLMLGLGLGIRDNTNSAIVEMVKAGDALNNAAKEKLSQSQFSSFQSDLMLDPAMGKDGTNYELELAKEQAYYDKSKAMLEQAQALKLSSIASYADLREAIEAKHKNALVDIQRSALQNTVQSLDASLTALEQFGQKQSGIYKAIFAVSKAFAIADALLALQQNIANASKIGFPYNIPFIAGAVAQGTAIISNISSMAGAFNNGGYIPTGQVGMVGEKGPEFVSGPANVFSTQNTKEAMRGGGSNTNVKVNVMNYGNSKVEVTESGSDKEKTIQIIIDRAKQSIASDAIRGDGVVDKTFASVFKLGRTG